MDDDYLYHDCNHHHHHPDDYNGPKQLQKSYQWFIRLIGPMKMKKMKTFSSCFRMKENEITPKKIFLFFQRKTATNYHQTSLLIIINWSFLLCVHVCIDRIDQSSIVSIIFILDVVVWYANVNYIHTQWLLIRVSGLFFLKYSLANLSPPPTKKRENKIKHSFHISIQNKNEGKKITKTNRPHTNKQTNNWIMNDQ